MSNVVNPHIAVLIKGAEDWWSDDEPKQLDMRISVTKDLDGEPNEAEVVIYNLNADIRARIADPSIRDAPIEIHFAAFGTSELTKCFVGEIETARITNEYPGMATRLTCLSQRWHSRDKNIAGQTYAAGTSIQQIVDDLTSAIDLPMQAQTMPTGTVNLAQTFNGPAFPLLEKFLWAYGSFCYICDGILYISDVYDPPNPTIVNITRAMQVSEPMPTSRKDVGYVEMKTVLDIQPKKKRRKKKKKPTWTKQALSQNDYADYSAVDEEIQGIECETLGTPAINPDNLVTFEDNDNQYRVQVVTHQGDTREGVTTLIRADEYDGEGTYGGAF